MNFSHQDKQRIENYYTNRLNRHGGSSAQALSWSSRQAQLIRFEALTRVGDLRGKNILDVGCGLGDLYQYLKQAVGEFQYLGIDLVPALVNEARRKYPQARFEEGNAFNFKSSAFDYVLSSGAMSFKVPRHLDKYRAMIRKMFFLSRLGLAFNMLDRREHVDDELYAAYNIREIEDYCRTLTPRVRVINDYSPQDFTVFLYP